MEPELVFFDKRHKTTCPKCHQTLYVLTNIVICPACHAYFKISSQRVFRSSYTKVQKYL